MKKKSIIVKIHKENEKFLLQNNITYDKMSSKVGNCRCLSICYNIDENTGCIRNKIERREKNNDIFLNQTTCEKSEKMKEMEKMKEIKKNDEKLLGAANFIIQHFIKCEENYSCSKTKLEKLLVIANLKCMKDENEIFETNIINRACGLGIDTEFPRYLCGDIVIGSLVENNCKIEKKCNDEIPYREVYNDFVDKLSDSEKEVLEKVFFEFGAYKREKLGELINKFKEHIIDENDNIVNRDKCHKFFNEAQDFLAEDNAIIKYIMGEKRENV